MSAVLLVLQVLVLLLYATVVLLQIYIGWKLCIFVFDWFWSYELVSMQDTVQRC